MTNIEVQQEDSINTKALIARLGWYTAFYAVSLIGYIGGSQGLWFWYITLRRPDWGLPGWGFTIAWTVIYGLMATALWPIWKADSSGKRTAALWLTGIVLILSAAWPWIMFVGHQMIGSWVESTVLAVVSLVCIFVCWANRPSSGGLMIIQFLWSAYLTLLGVGLWILNR